MRRIGCLVSLAIVAALFVVVQPVSEWLAGGWDPGVYMNQGIHLARHGLNFTPLPVFSSISIDNDNIFTRTVSGRREAYPGIPIDGETGTFSFCFYPVTPLWIAFIYRIGGMSATFYAMSILGVLSVILLFYGLRRHGWSKWKSSFASFLFLIQPIVLYHMHTPCSEMMGLMLMTMLLVWLSGFSSILLFPIILLACLNRPEFIVTAGVLGVLLSTGSWPLMGYQSSIRSVISTFAGVVLALIFYNTIGVSSVVKISRIFDMIQWGTAVCVFVAYIILLIRQRKYYLSGFFSSRYMHVAVMCLPIASLIFMLLINPRGIEVFGLIKHLITYIGLPMVVLTVAGVVGWIIKVIRVGTVSSLDVVLLIYLFSLSIPLGYKHIADLYPWALKRYLPVLPLLIAVFSINILWKVVNKKKYGKVIVASLIIFSVSWNAHNIIDAYSNIEYKNINKKLSLIADNIASDDVVVSDHFLWAAPLATCFDKQVLNGVQLWDKPSAEQIINARAFFYDMYHNGHRVLLLTSTESGVCIFSNIFDDFKPIMEPIDYTYNIIAHSKNSVGFKIRTKHSQFLLSEWMPKEDNND